MLAVLLTTQVELKGSRDKSLVVREVSMQYGWEQLLGLVWKHARILTIERKNDKTIETRFETDGESMLYTVEFPTSISAQAHFEELELRLAQYAKMQPLS
jgi:hypothetical protein